MLSNNEINSLVQSYKLGCLITGKMVYDNDILDLINIAKAARELNVTIGLVLEGNLPVSFEDGKLTIVCDKAKSI